MKDRILSTVRLVGGLSLARRLTGRSLRILGYHGLWIGEGRPYGNTLFMPVDLFAQRMRWLARSGYPVLDLPEAAERLAKGTLPRGATVITIDDGWRSIHSHMLPILEELGLPSTLYAATYYVERQTVVTNIAIACAVDRTTLASADLSDMLPGLDGPLAFDGIPARNAALHALNRAVDALPTAGERAAAAFAIGDRLGVPLEPFGDQFTYMSPEELADAQFRGMRVELHTHRHRGLSHGVDFLAAEIEDNRAALART
ncbi:MAG: polysaccharide deacetylase family protein, partial [Rhizorhabdus sp.]